MNSLESERLQNIRRNQEHLRELGIYKKHEVVRPASEKKIIKRQKLIRGQPSRASARIASFASTPVYNDETEDSKARVAHGKKVKGAPTKRTQPTKDASTVIPLPVDSAESLRAGWTNWMPSAGPPFRDEDLTFHFESHPEFNPNKSPEEMLREGCFGGSYFRPLYSRYLGITVTDDYKELPFAWTDGIDVKKSLTSPEYNPDVNKFKVSCGQSIEEWEAAGWIRHTFDVRGWFQWYCRFFMGRRCEDDERQVGRWKRCVGENGRWRRLLLKKYVTLGIKEVFDDGEDEEGLEVSPVMHQTCFHWALEIRQTILDHHWRNER
ncbi:MAG: hypothetical protein Q9216_005525 [Gyalolechia sp. 2 TL-2023]